MFAANNIKMLQEVYKEIDKLEPSAIRSKHYLHKHSLFIYPLALASLLLFYLLFKQRKEQS